MGCARFRFVQTALRLSDVWQREMDPKWAMPQAWNRFWHLGDVKYIQSTAWICIEELTGQIVSLDVEVSDPVSGINSSILSFMKSLKLICDWHQKTGGRMEEFDELLQMLEIEIEDAGEYWLPFLEYEQESEEETLEVSVT